MCESMFCLGSVLTINKACDTFTKDALFNAATKSRECYIAQMLENSYSLVRAIYLSLDRVKARTRCSMLLNYRCYRRYQKLPHDKVTRTDSVLTFYFSFGEYSCRAASGAISVLCS